MKKFALLIYMISIQSFGQIYVGASTPVYVKSQVLYVQQDINLAANSNLYLRNLSQLVQGTTGTSTNVGTGIVSVYQEGSADNFDYNYWCSPVGTNVAAGGNQNFGITLLNRPTTSTASTAATILPLASLDGTANPLAIASRWIYKLTNANSYSQWVQVGTTTTLAPGEGFTMKGTSGTDAVDPEGTGANNPGGTGAQRYDFRGKPNDGNITVTVGAANASTLTGNPYPSALHLNAFLLDPLNNACTGIAYFWEQDKTVNSHLIRAYRGGYATYSPGSLGSNGIYVPGTFNSYNGDGSLNTVGTSSGLMRQRKYAPIGQGFVIKGVANGTVTFRNSYRIFYKEGESLSEFEKPAKDKTTNKTEEKETSEKASNDIPHIRINAIINNEFTRQLALAFLPEATDGVDRGLDAVSMDNFPSDTFFLMEGKNYIITGTNFDVTKQIPLTVKAEASTTLKFYIPEVINFDPAQKIFIYDAVDASYHNIKTGNYEVTIPPGVFPDRFKITFTDKSLGTNEETKSNFFIMQDNSHRLLKASNPDFIAFKSFYLYDIAGKTVQSKENLGAEENYSFSTSGLSSGVYIATFITVDNEKIAQKVIISNAGN
ncbi:Por secretion system C-terminal sorting domain-containing protein [Flavobacterium sp. CF108]|uniref:T9SS type A sorting domain-containing protein n=1 Tax=unclassified Flavobacterium TaxID=196869 RepID=UPI0008CC43EE|nr:MULTISPECIES: T9SS type A sorting domain-containing protein [unclassified Flavobacterium]SEO16296.1 Por secretion system C-terminal sorting domain-containing protein [Flavobacterium sp. fv08]SHG56698.1 Por secretion system C-terminal sorting domain-containing protein [Flavobacterium sp. CF108]